MSELICPKCKGHNIEPYIVDDIEIYHCISCDVFFNDKEYWNRDEEIYAELYILTQGTYLVWKNKDGSISLPVSTALS
jgi:hypothetical protein